jgi:hypothetical protein
MEPGAAAIPQGPQLNPQVGEQLAALGFLDPNSFPLLANMTLAEIAAQQRENPQAVQYLREQVEMLEQKEARMQLLEDRNDRLKEIRRQRQQGVEVSYEDIEALSGEEDDEQQEEDGENVEGGKVGMSFKTPRIYRTGGGATSTTTPAP